MTGKWHRRAAHTRRGKDGQIIHVRSSTVFTNPSSTRKGKKAAFRQSCPECGAQIVSVNMKNGGWAHFEGGKGLGRVKHPCFDRGKGLSKRRDKNTTDLFEKQRHEVSDLVVRAFEAALAQYQETTGAAFPTVPRLLIDPDTRFWASAEIRDEGLSITVAEGLVTTISNFWAQESIKGSPNGTRGDMIHTGLVWLMLHEFHHYQLGHFALTNRMRLTEAKDANSFGIAKRVSRTLPPALANIDVDDLPKVEPCLELQADHDATEMLLDAYSPEGWNVIRARTAAISAMMTLIEREDAKRGHVLSSHPKAATRIFQLLGHVTQMPMIETLLADHHAEQGFKPKTPSNAEQSAFNREVVIPAFLDAQHLAHIARADTIGQDLGTAQSFFEDIQVAQLTDKPTFGALKTSGVKQWAVLTRVNETLLAKLKPEVPRDAGTL